MVYRPILYYQGWTVFLFSRVFCCCDVFFFAVLVLGAGILFELHKLFNERIPSSIIREFYASEAMIIDDDAINNG